VSNSIRLKRASTPGKVPATTDLELGELAVNTYDGKLFLKKQVGSTDSIVELGGSQTEITWTLLATQWESLPTFIETLTFKAKSGDVYSYAFGGVTRYRFVPASYDPDYDSFYTTFASSVLSGFIVSRSGNPEVEDEEEEKG
jgi:hypothetical protein